MQRSTKGLLASLLYQILDNNSDIAVFPADSFVWSKSFIDDWSSQELEKALWQFSQVLPRPICLFLDGLDELDHKKGPINLIELMDRLNQQDNFKSCLASRPERAYQKHYHMFPMMCLQDLTKPDMNHYVSQELGRYISTSHLSNDQDKCKTFVELIVGKAQGVFLWIYLVLRSLRQGIELRNDDWDVLIKRVEMKPSDLDELYRDMLARLGTEMQLYQREAAFYFAHILDGTTNGYGGTTLLEWSFANSQYPDEVINKGAPMPSLEYLNLECDKHQHRIEEYSAGLLEVEKVTEPWLKTSELSGLQWARYQLDALGQSLADVEDLARQLHWFATRHRRVVRFIHRTAADFLLETPEGQKIMAHHHTSSSEIRMEKWKSTGFSRLAGSGANVSELYEWLHFEELLFDQRQKFTLLKWTENVFFLSLATLGALRGQILQPTTRSLYSIAKYTILDFMTTASHGNVPYFWERYTKTVATQGYHLSKDLKTYMLVHVLRGDELWRDLVGDFDGHFDSICRLLAEGADASDMKRECHWFDLQGDYLLDQTLCAFDIFLSKLIFGKYRLFRRFSHGTKPVRLRDFTFESQWW